MAKYYEISYRKTYYITGKRYVKSELGSSDAIRKSRLKYEKIISVVEIFEEQYNEHKLKRKSKE